MIKPKVSQTIQTSQTSPALPILLFHTLEEGQAGLCFAPRHFERGLAQLAAAGFRTVSLSQAADHVIQHAPFPSNAIVITFDDGYETVYTQAFPILARFGMTATIFPVTGVHGELPRLRGRATLTWERMREMQATGIAFGAHTLTHPDLTRLSPSETQTEICISQKIIEDELGAAVTSFAYPDGRYATASRVIVAEHFQAACSVRLGCVTLKSHRDTLERVDGSFLQGMNGFHLLERGLLGAYLSTRSLIWRVRGESASHAALI